MVIPLSENNSTETEDLEMREPKSRFRRGVSGNAAGRPKHVPNKVTAEVRAAPAELVDDPLYRPRLLTDLRQRKVAPAVETILWYYAKGKPKERLEHTAESWPDVTQDAVRNAVRRGLGGATAVDPTGV